MTASFRYELFSAHPAPMLLVHPRDGRIVSANPAAAAFYGWSIAELEAMRVGELNTLSPDQVRAAMAAADGRATTTFHFEHRLRDGSTRFVEVLSGPVQVDGESLLHSIIVDETPRVKAEASLRRHQQLYRMLSAANHAVVRHPTRQALFDAICEIAVREGELRCAWVGLVDAVGEVRPVARAGAQVAFVDRLAVSVAAANPRSAGPTGRAITEGRASYIPLVETDARMEPWHALAREVGIASAASFPLRESGRVVGAMTLYSAEPAFFGDAELETLEQMAAELSFGLTAVMRAEAEHAATERASAADARLRIALAAGQQVPFEIDLRTGVQRLWALGDAQGSAASVPRICSAGERHAMTHPDDWSACESILDEYRDGRRSSHRLELRQRAPTGEWRWVLSVGSVTRRDADGRAEQVQGTQTDITTFKEAQAALAVRAEAAQAILGLAELSERLDERAFLEEGAALMERLTGSVISFIHGVHPDQENIELLAWSHRTTAEYCRASFATHYPISSAGIWADALRRREAVLINEYATATGKKGLPEGHAALLRLVSVPVIEGGLVRMLVGVGNKPEPYTAVEAETVSVIAAELWRLTQRRRAEQGRAEAERQLRLRGTALALIPDAVVITDREGRIEWANPAFTRLTGYSVDEAFGRNPRELVRSGAQDRSVYDAMWRAITNGEVWRGEVVNRRKDGTTHPEWLSIAPVPGPDGKPTHFVATKRDLTEDRALRARLVESAKLESIGRVAGSVAHDFNSLLTVIAGSLDLAIAQVGGEDASVAEDLAEARRATGRAASLTRQMLAFSRRQVFEQTTVDVRSLVEELVPMLQRMLGEGIRLDLHCAPDSGVVIGDPGQLEQAILHLAANARDAMSGAGTLWVSTATVSLPAQRAPLLGIAAGTYATLTIRDGGIGMDAQARARLFDPIAAIGGGEHGDLSFGMIFGMVRQMGGTIEVETAVGRGSTFRVWLPVAEHAAEAALPASAGKGAAILVVDDETPVRAVTCRILRRAGYEVLSAASAADAEALCAARATPPDLVLTDIVMPGMSGPELVQRLRLRYPDLRAIGMSGYSDDATKRHGVVQGRLPLIAKPFTMADLTTRVAAELLATTVG